jgi:hypothetical protein
LLNAPILPGEIILERKEAVGEGADRDTRGRVCSPETDSVGGTPTEATGTVALPKRLRAGTALPLSKLYF